MFTLTSVFRLHSVIFGGGGSAISCKHNIFNILGSEILNSCFRLLQIIPLNNHKSHKPSDVQHYYTLTSVRSKHSTVSIMYINIRYSTFWPAAAGGASHCVAVWRPYTTSYCIDLACVTNLTLRLFAWYPPASQTSITSPHKHKHTNTHTHKILQKQMEASRLLEEWKTHSKC